MSEFLLYLNRAQHKVAAEAMATMRHVARGELHKIADLVDKNRATQMRKMKMTGEAFDAQVESLRSELWALETTCTRLPQGRYISILKMAPHGQQATGLNKRFRNCSLMLKDRPNDCYPITLSREEITLVAQSCELMMRLLCGQIDAAWEWLPEPGKTEAVREAMAALSALGSCSHPELHVPGTITGIHHKAWWLHDIAATIKTDVEQWEATEKRGSLPLPRIEQKERLS
jgi:hypothetical protein